MIKSLCCYLEAWDGRAGLFPSSSQRQHNCNYQYTTFTVWKIDEPTLSLNCPNGRLARRVSPSPHSLTSHPVITVWLNGFISTCDTDKLMVTVGTSSRGSHWSKSRCWLADMLVFRTRRTSLSRNRLLLYNKARVKQKGYDSSVPLKLIAVIIRWKLNS